MCGTYADAIWASENLECMNIKCHAFGKTLVPWGATYVAPTMQLYGYVATQPYQPKEQDMCNENASWNLSIFQVGTNAYSVEISRKDKKSSDKIVREFDNFGTALEFATLTYEDLN